jgi:beta-galactosidase/beta-glucuronidase
VREPWLNLNGRWRFTFDPDNEGEQRRWYRLPHPDSTTASAIGYSSSLSQEVSTSAANVIGYPSSLSQDPFTRQIVVPFPWQSPLSEVCEPDYKGTAWYQRAVSVPDDWAEKGLRPFLCFGAVDWHARVWVNGRFAGEHAGGYSPFALDISPFVAPGKAATICVRAYDASDADTPIGKQTYNWYTHSGGIWQTVWLEGRPQTYIEQVHITPDLDAGRATFAVTVAGEAGGAYRLHVASSNGAFPQATHHVTLAGPMTETMLEVTVPYPKPWSPEEPNLYECSVSLTPANGDGAAMDTISTYFGLRKISRGFWDNKPVRIRLPQRQTRVSAWCTRSGVPPRWTAHVPVRRCDPGRRATGQGPWPEHAALSHQDQRAALLLLGRQTGRARDV